MTNGTTHTIYATRIVHAVDGDRVVGFRSRSAETDSFRLADIHHVETQEVQTGRSLAFGAGVVFGLMVVLLGASDDPFWNGR
jgi:hypothetical protein